jgi:hypothetical protein
MKNEESCATKYKQLVIYHYFNPHLATLRHTKYSNADNCDFATKENDVILMSVNMVP